MRTDNLSDFVKNALIYAGCHPSKIENFESYSTVKIDLKDAASIYIGNSENSVVIWSDLCEFNESIVRQLSSHNIKELIDIFTYAKNEILRLRECEGKLQIYLEIKDEHIDEPEILASIINIFFERQSRLMHLIRQ